MTRRTLLAAGAAALASQSARPAAASAEVLEVEVEAEVLEAEVLEVLSAAGLAIFSGVAWAACWQAAPPEA